MSEFFTPIQVECHQKPSFEAYQVEKYNDDPFQMTMCRIQSLGENKKKIIQWLKQMPLHKRIQQLSYTNKQFVSLFMTMAQKKRQCRRSSIQFSIKQVPHRGYTLNQQNTHHTTETSIVEAEEELLGSLLVMNKFSMFDTITVNIQLAQNINRLFQLFEIIQNGICYELTQDTVKDYENQDSSLLFYNPLQFDSPSKTIGSWVVEVLKKTLSYKYFETKTNQEKLCHNQFYNIKEKNKKIYKCWKKFTKDMRQKLINKVLQVDIRKILNDYRDTIHVEDNSFPKILYSSLAKVNQFKSILFQDSGHNIFRNLAFISLSDTHQSLCLLKYELLNEIEANIHKEEQIQQIVMMKKKKSQIKVKQKKKQIINIQSLSQQKINKIEEEAPKVAYRQKPKGRKKKGVKRRQKKSQLCSIQEETSQTTEDADETEEEDTVEDEQLLVSEKRNSQLLKIYQALADRIFISDKNRRISVNRMGYVLQKLQLSYQLYGSYATDLTIPNSDIDICIDPTIVNFFYTSFCSYREKIVMSLQFLKNAFQKFQWARNFNLISTASVPVLMFQINLNMPFDILPKDKNFNIPKLVRSQKQVNMIVDLTIEPYANLVEEIVPHLGQYSTNLIRDWCNQFLFFKETVKIIKYILQKNGLNKSFMGGFSSFVLIVVVVGYFLTHEHLPTLYETLLNVCHYLSSYEEKIVLDLRNKNNIFLQKSISKFTVINPLNGKNLTENCYRFPEIKKLCKELADSLESQSFSLEKFMSL